MYVRDHVRPEFHKALDIDPTEYDFTVFRTTSEISRQCFPLMLDTDHPTFRAGLERVRILAGKIADASEQGGMAAGLRKRFYQAQVGATLLQLYLLPTIRNEIPQTSRLQPAY
jgi:magnesium-protoporphyrin IX monomethyl ester (oxidative) cyclase